jgi:superfamily II DNA helicase RecQ
MNMAADEYERREMAKGIKVLGVRAVCINEDNNGPDVFAQLENGHAHICYASPEILLKNQRFKQLFRQEKFRTNVPAIFIDEAHVIPEWKDDFRRSYVDLEDPLTLCGSQTPCGAFTASAPTTTFETVYSTLKMGVNRPVFVIDVGSDRPNIEYNIRKMEHGITLARDVLSFLPNNPVCSREDLKKHIIYLPTRELCIRATLLLRQHLPEHQLAFWPFFATCSEDYKTEIFRDFKENTGTVRWLLATSAAGMGLDVPDIEITGSLGVRRATQAYQEAGRAVQDAQLHGKWVWLVPEWMIEPDLELQEGKMEKEDSKKAAKEQEMRDKADPGAIELVHASRDSRCLRSVLVKYFRPSPSMPGFPGQKAMPDSKYKVTYKCIDLCNPFPPVPTCCSLCVRSSRGQVATSTALPSTSTNPPPTTTKSTIIKRSCSKINKEKLNTALLLFRATRWKEVRTDNPFLDHEWILSDTSITHILAKAHILLGALSRS